MTPELQNASIYTDFNGLADLRRQAKDDPDATLRQVAEQFEAIFMQMMLKSMRDANFGDPMFDSQQTEFYQGMHDSQMALHMSEKGGLGLAEMLVQQLKQQRPVTGADNAQQEKQIDAYLATPMTSTSANATSQEKPVVESVTPVSEPEKAASAEQVADASEGFRAFSGPVDFIRRTWNMAKQAADELGTHPAVLIAQAALETGWGKSIQKDAQGNSSFNLFNIKADARWDRERVTVSTVEYRDGVARRERADFRSYSSIEESFRDYVDFVKSSPRYRKALEQASDPDTYIYELHRAGYATDPQYSNKIKGIMNRGVLQDTLGSIKVSRDETLS